MKTTIISSCPPTANRLMSVKNYYQGSPTMVLRKKKSSVLKVTLWLLLVNNDFLADIAILYSCYVIIYSQKNAPVVEKAEQVFFKTNI